MGAQISGSGSAHPTIMTFNPARFPSIWFNEATTKAGVEALGWYHEKRDEARNIGLGPEHDWSSHDADAFGLMCVVYETPTGRMVNTRALEEAKERLRRYVR
jgi:hypothetical protein